MLLLCTLSILLSALQETILLLEKAIGFRLLAIGLGLILGVLCPLQVMELKALAIEEPVFHCSTSSKQRSGRHQRRP
jgi:hypothetical protein